MKASTQACQWNPKTFPKISQPWQSNWLSISSNPPHQQPKLWELGCEIIFIWSSQRSRIIKAKNTRWEQSKPCLNTKEFVQAKLQTHRRWLGKSKDPSASQPPMVQNCGLECLHECWVISGMLFTSSYKERNSLCHPSRMWVCSRGRVPTERWNCLAAAVQQQLPAPHVPNMSGPKIKGMRNTELLSWQWIKSCCHSRKTWGKKLNSNMFKNIMPVYN